jgi:hypothetical protein
MLPVVLVEGSWLDYSAAHVLVVLTNCVTPDNKGIEEQVADRFPHANVAEGRSQPSDPGTSLLTGSAGQRRVGFVFSQWYPGASRFDRDNPDHRSQWLTSGLAHLADQLVGVPAETVLALQWSNVCRVCAPADGRGTPKFVARTLQALRVFARDVASAGVRVHLVRPVYSRDSVPLLPPLPEPRPRPKKQAKLDMYPRRPATVPSRSASSTPVQPPIDRPRRAEQITLNAYKKRPRWSEFDES